jgi:catechol 2,3-dioxygenase-like lactoylglutathione lyase family enzyme
MTVNDADRSLDFYRRVLDFERISDTESTGPEVDRLTGIAGARVRTVRLRLRGDELELTQFLTSRGRAIPGDARSNDRWFQHIAIITSDMPAAYERLRGAKVRPVSPAPQRLPDWNQAAAGIEAFYFLDPDGHVLEILHFPDGKGQARWHNTDRLFLGIDHTAIVVSDTEQSVAFYRDVLGLRVAGHSENYGPEQERLNNVAGAHLRITTLRGAGDRPGVEFLEYVTPKGGRVYPADAKPNDLIHWQTHIHVADPEAVLRQARERRLAVISSGAETAKPVLLRDPDGHAIELVP